ncbi:(d)CMP kinase [Candidatus Magnetaquicoccus inordinatus]|uniref:(d)CMP kinase n=1 Tax=Candidatus Magnetaquicoccus inordinatus TaxID=2496818 RepID=UPI00102BDB00|nr:(d)CMP kinase [Candidatus Magnetaquicoccus inordinatus]
MKQHPGGVAKGERIVIAVDGPAGAGKGAVCRAVASRLQLAYLETGAIYRALGLLALREELQDADALVARATTMPFTYRALGAGVFGAFLAEEEVTTALRAEEIGQSASRIAAIPAVRQALLAFQRRYGGSQHVILDGRDVGTIVWPDADLKIFLTASLEERAERRVRELQGAGKNANFTEIYAAMAERDQRDAGRTTAPLKPAEDALLVDTTHLTLAESIAHVLQLIKNTLNQAGFTCRESFVESQ